VATASGSLAQKRRRADRRDRQDLERCAATGARAQFDIDNKTTTHLQLDALSGSTDKRPR